MTLRKNIQSDLIGVIASGLCAIHCIVTPFLFLAQSCSSTSCCGSTPSWWSSIDYLFIGITFLAVYQSGKNSSKSWIKYGLLVIWGLLSVLVLNEKFNLLNIAEGWKYLTAVGLICLHLYNLKFCRCSEESCCVVA